VCPDKSHRIRRITNVTVLMSLSYIVFFMSMVITTLGQALSLAAR
jgi:hypothetical protein